MSETPAEQGQQPEQQPEAKPQGEHQFTPITSQADLDRIIGERIARERGKYADYADLKAKAGKFDEIEEKNKTELQKLQERAERAERERDSERLNLAKQQAAMKAGLPAEMAARLSGTTPEELAADATELAKLITPQPRGPRPTGAQSGDQGKPASRDWLGDALRNH